MAKLKNQTPAEEFDWESYMNGSSMNESSNSYDSISEYKQGIAIVTRNGKYGAIMVGNKEIVKPVYNNLSVFNNGYAKATYPSDSKERTINMSGQISVKLADDDIFLPDDYEWGFDFHNNICVVIKDGKYGVIDSSFKTIHECKYPIFEDFFYGYAVLRNIYDGIIIDEEGNVRYKISETFDDGNKIITDNDNSSNILYGMMNNKLQLIIPIQYTSLQRLLSGYFVADSANETKVVINPNSGKVILDNSITEIDDINKNFFVTYISDETKEERETIIYNSALSMVISVRSKIYVYSFEDEGLVGFILDDKLYKCDKRGNLYLVSGGFNGSTRKVCHNYLNYSHSHYSQTYEIIEDTKHKKGLCDLEGNMVLQPQYNEIIPFSDEFIIVASPSDNGKTLVFGLVDRYNNLKIPFVYNNLVRINEKYLAYTNDIVYDITKENKYSVLNLHSDYRYKFGIIDISGNNICAPTFNTIKAENHWNAFIIGKNTGYNTPLKYGLVNIKGEYILNPIYENINYNEQDKCFVTNLKYNYSHSYLGETLSNSISSDGFFLIKDYKGESCKVPTNLADWCGEFSEEGIAPIRMDGHYGHINKLNQIVSFSDNEVVQIPEKYDFASDFQFGYATVGINHKYGLIDKNLVLVIPCNYEYIVPLSENRFKFIEEENWGVVDLLENVIISPKYFSIENETHSFFKVQTTYNNSRYGIYDHNGVVIIPENCERISTIEYDNSIYLIITIDRKEGVYDENGKQIIPCIYDQGIKLKDDKFTCSFINKNYGDYNDIEFKKIIVYNLKGEQEVVIDESFTVVIPSEYDLSNPIGYGIIAAMKNKKWGLINISGEIIVSPQFSIVDIFKGPFAKVGISPEGDPVFRERDLWTIKNIKYGLIDTSGELVLPVEYDSIYRIENGYYEVTKDKIIWILTPSLQIVLECNYIEELDNGYYYVKKDKQFIILTPNFQKVIELKDCPHKMLGNNYIVVNGNYGFYLIDIHGTEVIPNNGKDNFFEINEFGNGFFIVKKYRMGCPMMAIFNSKGTKIYTNEQCDRISIVQNRLFLVEIFNGYDSRYYNIVDFQGKELFNRGYEEISVLNNGNISIYNESGYGMADYSGNIIVHPRYRNKIVFKDGLAIIEVKGSSEVRRIDINGNVVVHSNEKEVSIPKEYYWASDFYNGLSVVRSLHGNYIGVVNEQGEEIISAKYDYVALLDDKYIIVKEQDCYGMYSHDGKCIFPPIFHIIQHISKNRLRVVWNLKIASSWSSGEYVPCDFEYKYISSDIDFLKKNRSALCDLEGKILNDKKYLFIGKFGNGYARSYCNIYTEDNELKISHVGVVDINGNTIISPEYDGIILYDNSFARLRQGNLIGIANLKTKSITMFTNMCIKKTWDIDDYGRFIFTTDGKYDSREEEWTGNRGVANTKKVIVPPDKYQHIELLDNGLIKVSNNRQSSLGLIDIDNNVTQPSFGLLDVHGKEIIHMEYSYISDFVRGYASICKGGHYDVISDKHVGGKWGVIDSEGKIIIDIIHDEEQRIPENNLEDLPKTTTKKYKTPKVIYSDKNPDLEDNYSYYDGYYDNFYNDDDGYSKYGGYNDYDDQAIDEAFDGDPSLTWNCD